jgi:hypothetical protein
MANMSFDPTQWDYSKVSTWTGMIGGGFSGGSLGNSIEKNIAQVRAAEQARQAQNAKLCKEMLECQNKLSENAEKPIQLAQNFETPTNPAQQPPNNIPEGWRVREMPPSKLYPNGYWKLEKPMTNGGWQPIDPSTMKPSGRPQTHIPFPSSPSPQSLDWWSRLGGTIGAAWIILLTPSPVY